MNGRQCARLFCTILALTALSCGTAPPPPPVTAPCVRGTLGIEPNDISGATRRGLKLADDVTGAVVDSVVPGSPAEKAGVRKGDLLLSLDGEALRNACEAIEQLFALSCDRVELSLLREGRPLGVSVVPVEQNAFLTRACDDGSAAACHRLAWLKWSGSGIDKDERAARALYRQACADGAAEACAYLGYHLMEESAPAQEVVDVLSRACELGSGAGCAHLGYMYATGTLVARDDEMATPIYVRACELGDARGCYNAGLMYRDGRGVETNRTLAIAAYEEGCLGGSSTACTDLGW